MTTKDYWVIKKELRKVCPDTIKDIARLLNLTEDEEELLHYINQNMTRVAMSFKLNMCETKVSLESRRVISKLYNYIKRTIH